MALFQPQPPQPFIGGFQPLAPRDLAPSITAVPVNTPPFASRRHPLVQLSWFPPYIAPTQGTRFYPQPGPIINPPYSRLPHYQILASWVPGEIEWMAKGLLVSEELLADNPPFDMRAETNLRLLLDAWRITPPQPWMPRYYPQAAIVVADNPPPFVEPYWLTYPRITPPLPWMPRYYPQEAAVIVVENPPFNQAWLWTVLAAYGPTFYQIIQRQLSPGIPGQSVDLPPIRPQVYPWYPSPVSIVISQRLLSPGIPGMSVDNPPALTNAQLNTIISLWEAGEFPSLTRADIASLIVVAAAVNDPPFGMPPRWLSSVMAMWQPVNLGGIELRNVPIIQPGPPPAPSVLRMINQRRWHRSWGA
jgi:hypothetical protein